MTAALLGASIVFLGAIPSIFYIQRDKTERSTIPLLPFTGLFYGLFFGASVFAVHLLWIPEEGRYFHYKYETVLVVSTGAQLIVLIGLVALYAGYYLSRGGLFRKTPRFKLNVGNNELLTQVSLGVLILAYLVFLYVPAMQRLPSVGQGLIPAGTIGFGYFYIRWRQGELKQGLLSVALVVGFSLALVKHVTSGFLTPLALMVVYFGVLEHWHSGRIPWVPIICLPVIGLLVYPPLMVIRNQIWSPKNDLNLIEKLDYGANFLIDYFVLDGVDDDSYRPGSGKLSFWNNSISFRGLTVRVAHIAVLSNVVALSPEQVPFWKGKTYKPIFTSFIPRVIWRDKPEERTGNEFGRRYGFVESSDKGMSLNLPWITEQYANFGLMGVIFGMTGVGILLAFLESVFFRGPMTVLETVSGIVIVLPLCYQEANFSLSTGSLIPLVISLWVYFFIFSRLPLKRILSIK
jgi:hypothetical protein